MREPLAGLVVSALRVRPKGDRVRRATLAALGFIFVEALVGAALVKFRLVVSDDSAARACVMSFHLANTFFLLGSLALAAWWAGGGARVRLRGQGNTPLLFGIALVGALFVAATGAVTALGDTLFPARTLAEGLRQDLSTTHFLLKLRTLHPAIALTVGCYAVMLASYTANFVRASRALRRTSSLLACVFGAQVIVGVLNITLLAPVALQLTHLFVADLFWIALVLTTASALADDATAETRDAEQPSLQPAVEQT
ncbi:MAG: COX15/CtaA family protein [Acidobacteria bacterium]|nr:COX15/CtaA family protein [Acidobacteriota bacterium]